MRRERERDKMCMKGKKLLDKRERERERGKLSDKKMT